MKRQDYIEKEEKDGDGYWIYLKPGWAVRGEGTHAIVEDTKKRAYAKMDGLYACRCEMCVNLLARRG